MPFEVVRGVGRGMGVLGGGIEIVEGKGQFGDKFGASNAVFGVDVLCREGNTTLSKGHQHLAPGLCSRTEVHGIRHHLSLPLLWEHTHRHSNA